MAGAVVDGSLVTTVVPATLIVSRDSCAAGSELEAGEEGLASSVATVSSLFA